MNTKKIIGKKFGYLILATFSITLIVYCFLVLVNSMITYLKIFIAYLIVITSYFFYRLFSKKKINTFIEFLVNGIMNLYYYEYKTNKYSNGEYYQYQGVVEYYFFEDENGKMYAVGKKPDKILSDNITQSDNSYRGMTTYILKNAPNISKDIEKMQFNQKSFIQVTKDYHNAVCTDGQKCILYQNPNPDKSGSIVQISPFIGYNFCNFVYICDFNNGQYYANAKVSGSFPTIGVEIKTVNPRWTNFIGSQAELSVSQLKVEGIVGEIRIPLPHDYFHTMPVPIDANSAIYGKFKFGLIGIYPKYKILKFPTLIKVRSNQACHFLIH